jgi:hypothetical protein
MSDISAGMHRSPVGPLRGRRQLDRSRVTDFAQQSFSYMVHVTLSRPGETVRVGQACGGIGSVESVSGLIAPVTGTVRTRNDDLARTPELVNTDSCAPAGCSRPRSTPPH